MRTHYTIPDPITGYEINQEDNKGFWSIVSPKYSKNYVLNPSFEFDLFNWYNGSPDNLVRFSRSNAISIFGAYSASVFSSANTDPADSYIYTILDEWEAGMPIVASAYGIALFKMVNATALKLGIYLKQGNSIINTTLSHPLKSVGRWYRVFTSIKIPNNFLAADENNRIEIRLYHGGTENDLVYWDAIQVEQGQIPTTYLDGDQLGYINEKYNVYCWAGQPHRSVSIRSEQTRTGGDIINLSDIGCKLLEMQGLGIPNIDDSSFDSGMLPGLRYQGTLIKGRDLTLSGFICGDGIHKLREKLFTLHKLVAPSVAYRSGQFKMLYSQSDCCDDTLEITTTYNGGLEGAYDNLYQVRFAMSLLAHQPFFKTIGERGQALHHTRQMWINHIVQRKYTGEWDNLNNGVTLKDGSGIEEVKKVLIINNKIVAFGNFNRASSDVGIDGIKLNKLALYDDENGWTDIFPALTYADFTDVIIKDMVKLANNKLVFTGWDKDLEATATWITDIMTVTDCDFSFKQIGDYRFGAESQSWQKLAVDGYGNIYATALDGKIYKWSISENDWILHKQVDGIIYDMVFDVNNNLYVGGDFVVEEQVELETLKTELQVGIKWDYKDIDYEFKSVPQQVFQRITDEQSETWFIADSKADDNDPIVSYVWTVLEWPDMTDIPQPGGTGPGEDLTERLVKIVSNDIDEETLFIVRLTTTTSKGVILVNDVAIFKDEDDGLNNVQALTTDESITKNYNIVTVSPVETIVSADDPLQKYKWTNDVNLTVLTTREGEFDFTDLEDGDEVVITLETTTQYGGVNTNSVTLIKEVNKFKEVEDSATLDKTIYIKSNESAIYIQINRCYNAYVFGSTYTGCLGVLSQNTIINCIVIGKDNRAYLGAIDGLYVYTGQSTEKIGNMPNITTMAVTEYNDILLGNKWGVNKWNGYNIVKFGIKFGGLFYGTVINSIAVGDCIDTIVIGARYAGGISVSGDTPLFYPGSAETRPSFRVLGPGVIHEISNLSTNQSIYLNKYLQKGEILDLQFTDSGVRFKSSQWGNIPINPGTSSNFYLQNGVNYFSVWMDNTIPFCSDVTAIFPVHHISADALCSSENYTRYLLDTLETCCGYSQTYFIFGDTPSNECNDGPCGEGASVMNLLTGELSILVDCGRPKNICDHDPTCYYLASEPSPEETYDGFEGTTVVEATQEPDIPSVSVLIGCEDDYLQDSEDVDLQDSTLEYLT